ncbi:MAG: periplasmic heavy metal sensor [Pseudomonadota bacterium]
MTMSHKSLTRILLVSLLLNVAAASYITVRWFRDHHDRAALNGFTGSVVSSKAMRKAFEELRSADKSELKQKLHAARMAQNRLHAVITAEKLNEAALDQALRDARTARRQVSAHFRKTFRDLHSGLPERDRRALRGPGLGPVGKAFMDSMTASYVAALTPAPEAFKAALLTAANSKADERKRLLQAQRAAFKLMYDTVRAKNINAAVLEAAQAKVDAAQDQLVAHDQSVLRGTVLNLPYNVRKSIPNVRIDGRLINALQSASQK